MIEIAQWIVGDRVEWERLCENDDECKALCELYGSVQRFVSESVSWNNVSKKYPLVLCYERPYYDKDYLSTFYAHHARKFIGQPRLCARLHFRQIRSGLNDEGLLSDGSQLSTIEELEALQPEYLGYMVLRPNENGLNIGRSYLIPSLCMKKDADLILGTFSGDVLGRRYQWKSFPYMMQEGDFDVCAHIAVWTIIRYYGSKYRAFADTTLGDVVNKAHKNYGRGVSSTGLNIQQVADLMAVHSHVPIIVNAKDFDQTGLSFRNELITYVESAIPFVGFLSHKEHALAVVGHTKSDAKLLHNPYFCQQARVSWYERDGSNRIGIPLPLIDYASLISGLVVMDDNKTPYREIFDQVDLASETQNCFYAPDYGIQNIDAAIVPFHKDMQFGYPSAINAFKNLFYHCWKESSQQMSDADKSTGEISFDAESAKKLLDINYGKLGFAVPEHNTVFRIFLASSNTLKEHFREILDKNRASYNSDDIYRINSILYSNLPKFVWCIELSTEKEAEDGTFSGLVLIDSTAGTYNSDPWLHIQGANVLYVKSENSEFSQWELQPLSIPYPQFNKNLN